jgi:hypothetical protein
LLNSKTNPGKQQAGTSMQILIPEAAVSNGGGMLLLLLLLPLLLPPFLQPGCP